MLSVLLSFQSQLSHNLPYSPAPQLLFYISNSNTYLSQANCPSNQKRQISDSINFEIYLKYISHLSVKTLDEHEIQRRIHHYLPPNKKTVLQGKTAAFCCISHIK